MLSAQIRAMEILGIRQFLDPDREFTSLNIEEFEQGCKAMRWEIKELLGVGINDRDRGIAIAQRILKKLDRQLKYVGWTATGKDRRRVYKLAPLAEDDNREGNLCSMARARLPTCRAGKLGCWLIDHTKF
ncbi:MAG TPA: hypothetical protein V6C71_08200 [Coleofasciculaceae cyanobacterium]|jgi:hypothetical protein